MNGEQLEPQDQNCGPVAGAILENFPKEVEAATSYCLWVNDPLYHVCDVDGIDRLHYG